MYIWQIFIDEPSRNTKIFEVVYGTSVVIKSDSAYMCMGIDIVQIIMISRVMS